VEGDDVAILRDFIERNAYAAWRVVEQHMESTPLGHPGHERTYVAYADDADSGANGYGRMAKGFLEYFLDIVADGLGVATRAGGPSYAMRLTPFGINMVIPDRGGAYQSHTRSFQHVGIHPRTSSHHQHIGIAHRQTVDFIGRKLPQLHLGPSRLNSLLQEGYSYVSNDLHPYLLSTFDFLLSTINI
jgi:hypothetical protein